MIFSENPAVFGEPLEAFFPRSVIPRWLDMDEVLEQLAKHDNPRYAKMARLLLEIGRYYYEPKGIGYNGFTNSEMIYRHYAEQLYQEQRGLKVLLFNDKHALLDEVDTSIETLESDTVVQRDILLPALEKRATRLLLVQIRPVGPLLDTPEERSAWYRLEKCAQVLDIRLLDYLFIGNSNYYSLNSRCYFSPGQPDSRPPVHYQ